MTRILVTLVCLAAGAASAQPLENGPRIAALGGAGVALAGHSSTLLNPASPAGSQRWFAHVFVSRAYDLPQLDQMVAGAGYRITGFTASAAISAFGFEQYRDLSLLIGMARRVETARTRVGLRVTTAQVSVRGYRSLRWIAVAIGTITTLTPQLSVGFAMDRAASIGDVSGRRRQLTGGLMVRLAESVLGVFDVTADSGFPIDVRFGIEATPVPALSLRSGVSAQPRTLSVGIRIAIGALKADVAGQRHDPLGWSRVIGLTAAG